MNFENLQNAISVGNSLAPMGIAYRAPRSGSKDRPTWYLFGLSNRPVAGDAIEFVCVGLGRYPIAVSDNARIILSDMVAKGRYHQDYDANQTIAYLPVDTKKDVDQVSAI